MFNTLYSKGPFLVYSFSVFYGLAAAVFLLFSVWMGRRNLADRRTGRMLDWSMGFVIVFEILSRFGSFVYEKIAGLDTIPVDLTTNGRAAHVAAFVLWLLCLITPKSATTLRQLWECWAGPALIAAGIGYIGCYAYGCCYGCVVADAHPFAVRFPIRHNDAGDIIGAPALVDQMKGGQLPFEAKESLSVLPVQLYHAVVLCAGGAFVLGGARKFRWGGWFVLSVIYMMAIRCWLDTMRGDHIAGRGIYDGAPKVRLAMLAFMIAVTTVIVVVHAVRSRGAGSSS